MTEVCLDAPRNQFAAAAQPEAARYAPEVTFYAAPPRCAVHSNETYVPKGTKAADLAALFSDRQP